MNFLACDLGGTKVLIAIYEEVNKDSPPKLITKERYLSAEWESIYAITKAVSYTHLTLPTSCCV